MRNANTKVDGVDSMPAANYNAQRDELENAVLSADITLDADAGPDTDLNMLGKAMAAYANAGNVYQDSGVADAYVLSITTNLKTVTKYYDNMMVMFKAGATNTGASTVNVNTLGVKSLTLSDGTALAAGNITAGRYILANYSLSNDRFELITGVPASSLEYNVYIHATDGDYPTLVAYLASVPVAGDSVLYDVDETVSADILIPSNILIHQAFGRILTFDTPPTNYCIRLSSSAKLEGRFQLNPTYAANNNGSGFLDFNGFAIEVDDFVIGGTTTGTQTYGTFIQAGSLHNVANINHLASGTVTTILNDNSGNNSNDVTVSTGTGLLRSDGANTFTQGIKTDNVTLKTKVIEIGDWDMDADATKIVAHGLTLANIRPPVTAMVIRDDSTFSYPLTLGVNASAFADGYLQNVDATNVNLARKTGGIYDSTNFDSTSFNRGWITITYEA